LASALKHNFKIQTMKKIFITLSAVGFLLAACTKDFEEINRNPNAPENITPDFLLTNVITVAADRNAYEQGFRLANYLAQFAASVEFERIDRYEMGSNSSYWNTVYGLLNDIESMKRVNGTNEAYAAVGDIMRCHLFSQLTDMWGDVPYTEALKAREGKYTPAYDRQEDIYTDPETGILATLEDAVATLSATNNSIKGDVMFNNNLEKWIRFANSLQVRYLMRISKRENVSAKLQALADGGMLMQGNSDNAVVPYLSVAPNQFPMNTAGLGLYQEHRMTRTVDSILTLWDDPRVEVLYKPNTNGDYVGLQNGLSRETIAQRGIDLNTISLFGAIFRDVPNGVDGQYMQYAEVEFALAEAMEAGIIAGDAAMHYRNAVEASFAYYNTTVPADYFTRPAIDLGTGDAREKILTQKWLALINCGHEAWFNVRRTGIPALEPGPDNLNEGMYPVRYLYPESEQATNSANYSAAAARIGGDNINSKCWWEQ
jgi:hypothetical protein